MLLVRKPSISRQICVGYQSLQSNYGSYKYGSNHMTFNLKLSSQIHSSVVSPNVSPHYQKFGNNPVGLWGGQISIVTSQISSKTGIVPSKSTVCTHFELCRKLHTTSHMSTESKESNNSNTDGSKEEDKTLKMSTRIKIVTFLVATWAVVYFAANYRKDKIKTEERNSELKQVDIGASDYELIDQYGKKRTKKDFLGQWFLLYFGFTHCPDICPEELEKMAGIIDTIDSDKTIPNLLPVFVSVDPERDTPEVIGKYVAEFHKNFVGLTGSKDQIKQAAKAFRVYFSAGPRDEDNDYIVDHTIVMYLMNPQGNFVDYYGSRGVATEKIVESIKQNMKNYKRFHG